MPLYTGKPMISVRPTDDVVTPVPERLRSGQPPPPTQPRPHPCSRVFLCHLAKPKADGQPYDCRVRSPVAGRGGAAPPDTPPAHGAGRAAPIPPARASACHLAPRVTKIAQRSFSARGVLDIWETPNSRWGKCPKPLVGAEGNKAAVGCPSHYPAPRDMHKAPGQPDRGTQSNFFRPPPPTAFHWRPSYPIQRGQRLGGSPPSPARFHTDDSDKTSRRRCSASSTPHAQPDSHHDRTSFSSAPLRKV